MGTRWRNPSPNRGRSGNRSRSFPRKGRSSPHPPFAGAGVERGADTRPGRPGTPRRGRRSRSASRGRSRSRSHHQAASPLEHRPFAGGGVDRGARTRSRQPGTSRPRWHKQSRSRSRSHGQRHSRARSAPRREPSAEAGVDRGADTRPGRRGTPRPCFRSQSPGRSSSRSLSSQAYHTRSPSRRPNSSKSRRSCRSTSGSFSRSRSGSRSTRQPSRGRQSRPPRRRNVNSHQAPSSRGTGSRGRSTSPDYRNVSRLPRSRDRSSSMETGHRTKSYSPPRRPRFPSRGYSLSPPARNVDKGKNKELGEKIRSSCPGGDTRWPPPGEWVKPLHFLYRVGERKRKIFYHLVHDNAALEVQDWMGELDGKAAEAASKVPADEESLITIMNALNSRKLRPISEGMRGKVWILDEGCEEVWECMKTMTEERGAVRLISGLETFDVLGVCLKRNKGDVLLVSQVFSADGVMPPQE